MSQRQERWQYHEQLQRHINLDTGVSYRRPPDACPCCGRPEGNTHHGAVYSGIERVKVLEHVCWLCSAWYKTTIAIGRHGRLAASWLPAKV